jgi:hypothetical protein
MEKNANLNGVNAGRIVLFKTYKCQMNGEIRILYFLEWICDERGPIRTTGIDISLCCQNVCNLDVLLRNKRLEVLFVWEITVLSIIRTSNEIKI